MDALQQIITSLTPPEKRYFKLFANAFHENTGLDKLFNVLDTDKEISDEVIKKKTGIKNLPVSRSNLRKLILKAIRVYNEENSQSLQLRNMLTDMEWLEGRGHVEEAMKEMRRAEKFATERELYWALPNTALLQRRTFDHKSPDEFMQSYEKLIDDVENYSNLMGDYYNAVLFNGYTVRYVNIARANHAGKAKQTMEQLLVKANARLAKTKTVRGRILMLAGIEGLLNHMGRFDEAFEASRQIFAIYDNNEFVKENPLMLYLGILANYCSFCVVAKRYDDWRIAIEQLKAEYQRLAVPRGDKQSQWKIRSVILYHSARYAQTMQDSKFIEGVDEGLLSYIENYGLTNIPEAINSAMLYYISYHIAARNYNEANEWLNRFYQYKHAKLARGTYLAGRLLEVILFYEQNDFDIADTKAINLYKTIMELSEEMQGAHQKIAGTFLRRLCQWKPSNKNDVTEIKTWLLEVEELTKQHDSFFTEIFGFFDVTGWLHEKFIAAGTSRSSQ